MQVCCLDNRMTMSTKWTCLIPSQSARSRAFASAVDSPTIRSGRSVWDEMKFVLETITSSTGPRSLPAKQYISSLNVILHSSLIKNTKHQNNNTSLINKCMAMSYVHFRHGNVMVKSLECDHSVVGSTPGCSISLHVLTCCSVVWFGTRQRQWCHVARKVMHHWFTAILSYELDGLREGDEHPTLCPGARYTLSLPISFSHGGHSPEFAK